MIRLRKLSKIYRTSSVETLALNEVNIDIASREFVAVMGPSGCGKSTLLNIIGMIDSPSDGEYFLGDREIGHLTEYELATIRKHTIGFVFQNFNLIDDLTVQHNVALPLLYLNISRKKRRTMVREALELVGLNHRAQHKPQQLSGGQQQRVAIARAIVTDPKIILADEPTGNLDTHNGEEIMNMLGILQEQGATILMVTHSPIHSQRADRIIEMVDGGIVDSVTSRVCDEDPALS